MFGTEFYLAETPWFFELGLRIPIMPQNTDDVASFVSTASSGVELQEEVWLQRRIELWGEGFSFFDLLRLKKPIIRKDPGSGLTNYGALAIFNTPAEASYMLWPLPQEEMQTNNGIEESQNNDMGTLPTSDPVKDVWVSLAFKQKSPLLWMMHYPSN